MIKRIPALIFILLANIVILASAVIPHHHHKSQVCIVNSHCQSDNEAHQHNIAERSHKHDGEGNFDYCLLKQVFVTPSNDVMQEKKILELDGYHFQTGNYQAVLIDKELLGIYTNPSITYFSLLLIYSNVISSCLGLRAPPIV